MKAVMFLMGYLSGIVTVLVVLAAVAVRQTIGNRTRFHDRQAVTKVDVAKILSEMDGGEEGNGKM